MSKKYRAVVIGLGNIGYNYTQYHLPFVTTHVEAYLSNPDVELVAVCDTNEDRLNEWGKQSAVPVFTDIKTMLVAVQPDIVSIATPDDTHMSILCDVVNSTSVKGVWCEKPLALSLADAHRMVNICQEKKISLLVNFLRRYDPLYIEVKQKSHELVGDVQTASCYYSGGLVTVGSHMADLLLFLFGECLWVKGEQSDRGVSGQLGFANNVVINFIPMDGSAYSIFECDIFGTIGRLDLMNKPFGEYEYRFTRAVKSEYVSTKFVANAVDTPIIRDLPRIAMGQALSDLILSISHDTTPVSSGQSAIKSLEIISALWHSANNDNKKVILPLPIDFSINLPPPQGDVALWKKH